MALHYTPDLASDIRCDNSLLNRQIGSRKYSRRQQALSHPNPESCPDMKWSIEQDTRLRG